MQREIERQLHRTGTGTKAQQALQQQREQNKTERHACSREQKEQERKDRFELHRCKQKEKHRGH